MNTRERLRQLYARVLSGDSRALRELFPLAVRGLEEFLARCFPARRGGLGLTETASEVIEASLRRRSRIADWDHASSYARVSAVRRALRQELKQGKRRTLSEAIAISDPQSGEREAALDLEDALVEVCVRMNAHQVRILSAMVRGGPLREQAAAMNVSLATLKRQRQQLREHIRRVLFGD